MSVYPELGTMVCSNFELKDGVWLLVGHLHPISVRLS